MRLGLQTVSNVPDTLSTRPQAMLSVSVSSFALNVAPMGMVTSLRVAAPTMMAKSKSMPFMDAKEVRRLDNTYRSPCHALLWKRGEEQQRLERQRANLLTPARLCASQHLQGMVGNVDFDPLGLSTPQNINWMREAELKHGRMAQLAWAVRRCQP